MHGTVARNNFMDGFTARIGFRLAEARDATQAEARTADETATQSVSVELVLRNKEVEILDFYTSEVPISRAPVRARVEESRVFASASDD